MWVSIRKWHYIPTTRDVSIADQCAGGGAWRRTRSSLALLADNSLAIDLNTLAVGKPMSLGVSRQLRTEIYETHTFFRMTVCTTARRSTKQLLIFFARHIALSTQYYHLYSKYLIHFVR